MKIWTTAATIISAAIPSMSLIATVDSGVQIAAKTDRLQ